MIGIEGVELLGEERERLGHPAVGGVILFARNHEAPDQLLALTQSIRALRSPPLLIATDQEGGRVQRIRDGVTALPAAGRLGRAAELTPALARETARQAGWLMASELRSLGVDFSFAPVLDIDYRVSQVIGDRAFSGQPDAVAALGLEWQRGCAAAGMACVGKHFPGHGGVAPDSHLSVAEDHRAVADLEHADLLPFRRLIDNGLAAVMLAHLVFPAVDAQPVGFSRRWVRYLRGSLGFGGAIFSDDLEMAAAAVAGDLPARILAAIDAGCDMAIVGNAGRTIDPVLDRLPAPDPRSALRLARMHGRGGQPLTELQAQPAYQTARAMLGEI
jgi:beta-N-acetylhexosaminidase